ncbi:hypothetical protein VOLCADRAFT_57006 [Volvox carteri f. nagariensis]|uniref:Nucleolar GTP-binding protein 1 n=1 Tax=Volvox carteri f. nagariensis TaxID=3068 RepID=D8TLW5_VOLCA|nr:uncharacterized protein VOLCADRAFT_57006 [Volvox carteri f. nagariensis]EFJ51403.1 hypothetical protein VOLCADRAFT_57006 [Volvox carteri f. nagariensis]|eukprot:XP_002947355.1 hypothetical protein VOLCADRAFT_57006 [Volvox carteri f. nagariensis]
MPTYNLKAIGVVPGAKDFIDIVLSKTQRGTPTVVHNGWAIQRIRQFYMRKVKFTQQNWNEKLSQILEEFPKVEDIHPFYADLLNVLYDKDHYKLALGQINTARNLIDRVAQDYIRLLKYGDSLYRCKELKRAALGRMCTLMKRQGPSLAYLEQVRQHMSRLPSIDPNTRTLLLCGYPNVGKSSMMNKLTRADVEVQPYAFTTKSLYVGHMDYKYLRWQVIDTPGILDRPLEERNTIEMQSITALAHLRAAVLYLVDISEQCGYTIVQQAALFHSIKPLFANKPVLIVVNKIDARRMEDLSESDRQLVDGMVSEARKMRVVSVGSDSSTDETILMAMSTLNEEGVMAVACDRLLNFRVEMKVSGKRIGDVLNKIHVAQPRPREGVTAGSRPPVIPPGVAEARARRAAGEVKKTERDLQEENGGAGVYSADLRKHYSLENPEWKYDIMPEIMDGHNVLDFVDPDIDAKLAELEREEAELEVGGMMDDDDEEEDGLTVEQQEDLKAIRARKKVLVGEHRSKKNSHRNQAVLPAKLANARGRTTEAMTRSLGALGIDASKAAERARSQSRGRKRERSASKARSEDGGGGDDVEMGEGKEEKKRVHSSKSRCMSRGRSQSLAEPRPGSGVKDVAQRNKGIKMADRAQRRMNKMAKVGESDRAIPTKMPKHLFSGKKPGHSTRNRR